MLPIRFISHHLHMLSEVGSLTCGASWVYCSTAVCTFFFRRVLAERTKVGAMRAEGLNHLVAIVSSDASDLTRASQMTEFLNCLHGMPDR